MMLWVWWLQGVGRCGCGWGRGTPGTEGSCEARDSTSTCAAVRPAAAAPPA
mgnify:CR=1 FL=1